uniref:mitogen-activated protein kinase n=1 Tax=Haliotis discus discus TaxID=91233 RepID=A0A7I6IV18_HALDI|nr:p38 mitogen-activated protein kinase [Haliotis discus discus]
MSKDRSPPKPGYYHTELVNTLWEVPNKYKKLNPIGTGAYGQVCSATDTTTNKQVAIKKLARPFQTETHAKRAYREIRMLRHFHHENIICLQDLFTPDQTYDRFGDVYLVLPYMDTDLHEILKLQALSNDHIQFMLYQILRGLKYIHSAGIIHRDLKPNNIGVNQNSDIKILDFGLARSSAEEMTGYVVCRWYRAPEIMLNWMHYNQKVDIWSVGCILAEMITRRPLFKGSDHIDQLNRILQLTGTPNEEFIAKMVSGDARRFIRSQPKSKRKNFSEYFHNADPHAVDLLEKTLDLDPDSRISIEQALAHPYLRQFYDPEDEPLSPPFDSSFEDLKHDCEGWRKCVYDEICKFSH